MGNSIGGKKRRARVMTVDGATHKYRAPAAAADALRGHPAGHHLLESDEVRRLGVRARPLDPDAPLKPGKLYFLVELPRLASSSSDARRRAPQRTWSGALTYGGGAAVAASASAAVAAAGAGERLESLLLARRSASDVASALLQASGSSLSSPPSVEPAGGPDGGAVRLRVRLPKADVQRLVEGSRDAAEAAERIMQLCVARDQRRHRSAPGTPLVVPVNDTIMPVAPAIITSSSRKKEGSKAAVITAKKEVRPSSLTSHISRISPTRNESELDYRDCWFQKPGPQNARLQTFGIFLKIYLSHYKYKLIFNLKY
jgi:hypothetical protein